MLTTPVTTESIHSAIAELRKNARSSDDVGEWFKNNLNVLGLPQPDDIEDVDVSIFCDACDLAKRDRAAKPYAELSLEFTVKNGAKRHKAIDSLFVIGNDDVSKLETSFSAVLYADDWRFLTAELAAAALNGDVRQLLYIERPNIDIVLTEQIPRHFSGMTWAGLQAMHGGDLLPKEPGDKYYSDFIEFLFMHQGAQTTALLPEVVSP